MQLVKSMTSAVACCYLGSGEVIDITTSEENDASASDAIVAPAAGTTLPGQNHLFIKCRIFPPKHCK